ncbi:CsgG/HfaB family protein [Nitratiruptor sp. YY09-18]|uniref:CsgG/HfaB family protein n=1 Tax=Nitratiruptor sp. YY09-18 TaxID=2724901 RepID=UPI001915F9EF|nr:CsgG/HfaB family protein [Nitratiruptor sp. YY09-18]BCD67267.1 hypothetical protein NitYY0918_C0143 [Nitratiruptor sp. YY09-18]
MRILKIAAMATVCLVMFSGCAQMQMGSPKAKTTATGSAAGSTSQGANRGLEHCSRPLGTLAIHEDTSANWYQVLTNNWHLGSTVPVLKLLAQQSNCFVVVERGRGMSDIMRERELAKSGELRRRSHFGKGQMVAADYTLIPSITFSAKNTSGIGGAIGGLFGRVAGAIAGGIKTSDASTILTLVDNRSGVQIAAAEGSARNIDFNLMGGIFSGVGAGVGGYSNTPEGKVIVAAFTDSFNKLVRALRNYKAQRVEGGLGTGGKLKVQGSENTGLVQRYEGVIVSRKWNPSTKRYDYVIITKDRSEKFTFSSRKKIPYKDDLVRFNVIDGKVDPSSIRLIERRYYQKYWQ